MDSLDDYGPNLQGPDPTRPETRRSLRLKKARETDEDDDAGTGGRQNRGPDPHATRRHTYACGNACELRTRATKTTV
jgi:hypothetical protein